MIKADYLVIKNILESIQVHVSRSVINGEEKILFKLNISCSKNNIFQNEMSSFKSFQIKKKKKRFTDFQRKCRCIEVSVIVR